MFSMSCIEGNRSNIKGEAKNDKVNEIFLSEPESGIPLIQITLALAEAMDLMNAAVVNHQKQVSYIAGCLAESLGLSTSDSTHIIWAGLLHDSGAFSLRERLEALEFELTDPEYHAEVGYRLIKRFRPLSEAASLIRHHHLLWRDGCGSECDGKQVPLGSHILHLADRAAVLIGRNAKSPVEINSIVARIEKQAGLMFMPELVEAFVNLAGRDSFWDECTSRSIHQILLRKAGLSVVKVDWDGIQDLSMLFCRLIDFRSPWTATHSRTVADCADALAMLTGFPEHTRRMIKIAGYLHDLGKLAIPLEILEKPAKLTREEFEIVKLHPFHTFSVLSGISGFDEVRYWAALHHESPDGTGYPLGNQAPVLPMEARILTLADVFSALSENRPYRVRMTRQEILGQIRDMAKSGHLDPELVACLANNLDYVDHVRAAAQCRAMQEYRDDFAKERPTRRVC